MFNEILDRLKNRIWIPMSEAEAVDKISESFMNDEIDEEEKEMLLDLVWYKNRYD